jgi:hypothetical protein
VFDYMTPEQRRTFHWLVRLVSTMVPGTELHVHRQELEDIPCREYNGAVFTPPDRILEQIVGASYEFSYYEDHINRTVVFRRRSSPVEPDGELTYVSPDRREMYERSKRQPQNT